MGRCSNPGRENAGAKRWLGKLLGALAAFSLLWIYRRFNPDGCRWFPGCAWHSLTGLECAGCGAQRALHLLLNGEFAAAFRMNAYLFVAGPVWAAWCAIPGFRRMTAGFWIMAATVPLYIVARNVSYRCFGVHF